MKTSIESEKQKKIKSLETKISQDKSMLEENKKLQAENYDLVKDFALSDNKTKIVLEKMGMIKSQMKTISRRITKNESELAELL
jgi:hypothetical protein